MSTRPIFCPQCVTVAMKRTLRPATASESGFLAFKCPECGWSILERVARLKSTRTICDGASA